MKTSIYVFDTNTLSNIGRFYYESIFRSFWNLFETYVIDGQIVSVRDVKKEIEKKEGIKALPKRLEALNRSFFRNPNKEDSVFITRMFQIPQFRNSIKQDKLLSNDPYADPFIIAKAQSLKGTVVTEEKHSPNSGKIPTICEYYQICCINLEQFFSKENWTF